MLQKEKKEQQQGNVLEKKLNKNDNYLQTKGYGIVYIRTMNKGNIREEGMDWINIYCIVSTPSPIATLLFFYKGLIYKMKCCKLVFYYLF